MSMIPQAPSLNSTTREYDLIPDGQYPARFVRFIGLGMNKRKPFQGTPKSDAFKSGMTFELYDADPSTGQITPRMVTGTETKNGVTSPLEPQPSCSFKDMDLFPGAQRGNIFDFVQTIEPGIKAAPNSLEWFREKLSSVVQVTIGRYEVKENGQPTGRFKNCINSIDPFPAFMANNVPPASCDLIYFDPYTDSEEMTANYAKLPKFQRDILANAVDSANIHYAGLEPAREEQGQQAPATSSAPANNGGAAFANDDIPF